MAARVKTTDAQVAEIRRLAAEGTSRKVLAWRYKVSLETIARYCRGETRFVPTRSAVEENDFTPAEPTENMLRASAQRLFEEQEKLRQGRGDSGPPAAPVSDVSEEGTALTPERVLWLLGQE